MVEKQDSAIPTVSAVIGDTLVELVRDEKTARTGLVVSRFGGLWNIEQELIAGGRRLVPYGADNSLIANNCVLLPSTPGDYASRAELLADIQAFLHCYVDLSAGFETIAAHYVLLSWVYDRFNELPYLRLRGEYGTGKTRALTAIGSLCYKPFFASGASTVSPIFHTLNAFTGTLVLDEADLSFSDARAQLVKILNNGTVRGMPVLRTLQNRHKEFNPAAFKVFGPKIIAMRGRFQDAALESRFLTEETGTRPLRPDIPIQTPEELHADALALRNRLLHFRLCEYFKTGPRPAAEIEKLDPRLRQIALPLLSLADDPASRAVIVAELRRHDAQVGTERRGTAEAKVLQATLSAAKEAADGNVPVGMVARHFNRDAAEPMSGKWIGYMLRTRLNIVPMRKDGVYVIGNEELHSLKARAERIGLPVV